MDVNFNLLDTALGDRVLNAAAINAIMALSGAGVTVPGADSITAKAGGGRTSAVQLGYGFSHVTVVANAADSVALPPAVKGNWGTIANDGAHAAQVFAAEGTSDTIDGVAAATGIVLTNPKRILFFAPANGVWLTMAGVASS